MDERDTEQERREFPWRIRMGRKSKDLTLAALGARVGVSKGALSRYETGDLRVLGDDTLRVVCKVLEIRVPEWMAAPVPAAAAVAAAVATATALYYCPTPFCQLQRPLLLATVIRFMPGLVLSDPGCELECRYCAATMFPACRHCDAPLDRGNTACPSCHRDYVPQQPMDATTMGILQFNAAVAAKDAAAPVALPFWAPSTIRAAAPPEPGAVGAGSVGKLGGSSHGSAS